MQQTREAEVVLSARLVSRWILLAIASLVSVYVALRAHRYVTGRDTELLSLLHLGEEANVPTFFSAVLLLIASGLSGLIAHAVRLNDRNNLTHWRALALIFLFLSFDEATELHERLDPVGRAMVDPSGLFAYPWVVAGIMLAVVFAASYIPFLVRIDRRHRMLFIVSGCIFMAGAVGMEMASAYVWDTSDDPAIYFVVQTAEEVLEMLGIAVFIYSLLSYIQTHFDGIVLRIGSSLNSFKG